MKSTGVVRKVDELGRIVLPISIRQTMDIKEKDPIEIFTDENRINAALPTIKKLIADVQGSPYVKQKMIGTDELGDEIPAFTPLAISV